MLIWCANGLSVPVSHKVETAGALISIYRCSGMMVITAVVNESNVLGMLKLATSFIPAR